MTNLRTTLLAGMAMATLAGCASEQAMRKDVSESAEPLRKGPEATALVRTITNFTPALRCMDNTMAMYGIRDLVVISEDIDDKTKKVAAGTKDMLISAVSEMTRGSRAIKLIAYGNDSGNLISFMKESESKGLFQLRPQFGIRGSISQLDENIAKKTEGFGLAIEPFFGAGKASTASTSILGLDLTMMSTEDLTIIPGVTSNNSVAIMRSGSGVEGEAGYKKFGINYQMNLSRSDGMSQALRNLVNLAVIELFGKLTKTPYWICLGGTTESEAVRTEISDWYNSLFYDQTEFVAYWQNQLRLRGLYEGMVNGLPDESLRDGIIAYRQALGLEANAKLDLAFFTAYLSANHYEVAQKAMEIRSTQFQTPQPATAPATADTSPIPIRVGARNGAVRFKPGESIVLSVRPERNAYVYCFMQDAQNAVMRFFPNRFNRDALVAAGGLTLPQKNEFQITASKANERETVLCFATNRDVFPELPAALTAGDFEALPVGSLAEVRSGFQRLPDAGLGMAQFQIDVR